MSGTKYDAGKPRPELLSADALLAISQVLAAGAVKYDDNNWRGGFNWSRLIGAAYRHLLAFHNGEDKDPETGLSHLAHLGCCVMFLIEHQTRNLGKDDRYKHQPKVKQFQNPPLVDDDEESIGTVTARMENDPGVDLWCHSGMGIPFAK